MKKEEFIKFEDAKPQWKKWIIVTNDIDALNSYGEMSNVRLTLDCFDSGEESKGIVAFDTSGKMITNLTHWKYT